MNINAILQKLHAQLPGLMAVYAFGSRTQGTATPESDMDMAVLVEGYADPEILWQLAGELADIVHCDVDLLDMRAASTVMQYQILNGGERWWQKDTQADMYEAAILSEKTELDYARAGLLSDIQSQGTIYGR